MACHYVHALLSRCLSLFLPFLFLFFPCCLPSSCFQHCPTILFNVLELCIDLTFCSQCYSVDRNSAYRETVTKLLANGVAAAELLFVLGGVASHWNTRMHKGGAPLPFIPSAALLQFCHAMVSVTWHLNWLHWVADGFSATREIIHFLRNLTLEFGLNPQTLFP